MKTPPPTPTNWHCRPKHFEGACPFCGFVEKWKKRYRSQHRVVDPADGLNARYLSRRPGPEGWITTTHGVRRGPAPRLLGAPRRTIEPKTRQNIALAARLVAEGTTFIEVAAQLAVTTKSIENWRKWYPKFWRHDFARELERVKAEAVARGPEPEPDYVAKTIKERRWSGPVRLPVGPSDGELTDKQAMPLLAFLHKVYIPSRLTLKPATVTQMEFAIRLFERWAGRPLRVADLNRDAIVPYLGWYLTQVRPATVNAKRRYLVALRSEAYEQGFLDELPRKIRTVKAPLRDPEAWDMEEVGRILSEAGRESGAIEGIPAGDWWVSLLLATYDCGCRIGAIKGVQVVDVFLDEGRLVLRAEHQKDGRERMCPLSQQTVDACRLVWSNGRHLMWPWPFCREWLERRFKRILRRAEVSYGPDSGGLFHKIRRTSGTLVEVAGGDGSQHLGNTRKVFEAHYLDPRFSRRQRLDQLPRPELDGETT